MAVLPGITELCRYQHDAMDRLAAVQSSGQTSVQRFYCNAHLITEIQDKESHRIFRHGAQLLAQQQNRNNGADITLLATDKQNSVTHALDISTLRPVAYAPYGHHVPKAGVMPLPGFNGEHFDPVTGHYLLGNYRYFNPVLKRFNLPDRLSPFGAGGRNGYAYCNGDPVNRSDPTGHYPVLRFGMTIGGVILGLTGLALEHTNSVPDGVGYGLMGLGAAVAVGSIASIAVMKPKPLRHRQNVNLSQSFSVSSRRPSADAGIEMRERHWFTVHSDGTTTSHDPVRPNLTRNTIPAPNRNSSPLPSIDDSPPPHLR